MLKRIWMVLLIFGVMIAPAQYSGGGGGTGGSSGSYAAASATYTAGTTYFFPPGGSLAASTTETAVQGRVKIPGTVKNFSVHLGTDPGNGNTLAFTWRDNTTDQSVTCTVTGSAGGTSKDCDSGSLNFPIAVNDLIDIKLVPTGTPAATTITMLWGTPGTVGPQGLAGTSAAWLSGATCPPSNATGNNTDMYLCTGTSDVYGPKASGAWPGTPAVNIKGLTGAAGTNGTNGTSAAWLSGSTCPPSNGTGNNTDMYLCTGTSDVYGPKAAGAWPGSPAVNIKGLTGATGGTGPAGPPGTGNNAYCADASGSTTTYTCSAPTPSVSTLSGLMVTFVPQTTNSGAGPSLNVASLGAKVLYQSDGVTQIGAGTLIGGNTYLFSYNGSKFVQASSSGSGGSVFTSSGALLVSSGATPQFNLADLSGPKSPTRFEISPLVNVTGPTIINRTAGAKFDIAVTTDGTHTWNWNGIIADGVCPIYTKAAATTTATIGVGQDGTTLHGLGCWVALSSLAGFGPTGSAPSVDPGSGNSDCRFTAGGVDCLVNGGTPVHYTTFSPKSCSAGQHISSLNTDQTATCTADSGSSPLTTKGDIFVHGASDTRLPVGADGQVVVADSTQATGLNYQTIIPLVAINPQTASYLLVTADEGKTIPMNGSSLTATLPNPPPSTHWYSTVLNLNTTDVTVSRNSLTINGKTDNVVLHKYQWTTCSTDGSNYLCNWPSSLSCQPGLGDGLNAIPAGTYLSSTCYNDTGSPITILGIRCFSDNNGTSTLNATNGAATGLLTGAVTCTNSFAAGTQSATVTLAAGDYIKFSFVADGATKQTTWVITETH